MEDFLKLDAFLTEEERLIRQTATDFVEQDVRPIIADCYEQGTFPKHLITRAGELGFLGTTLPPEYGGSGASYVAYGLINQELERGDAGLRSFVSVQSSLCMFPIFQYGTEAQKRKYLPSMAKGETVACFGLTEPDSGSDPGSMRTIAHPERGGWRINGTKTWITNAPFADVAVVWAQTPQGIQGFLIEKNTIGFQRLEIKKKMSLRASATGELVMEDCWIPEENRLPHVQGLKGPLACLNQARYGVAWGAIGAAIDCYETARTYTGERVQFGKPIASFQLIQKDLAEMLTEIVKAQLLNLRLGQLKDQGQDHFAMTSMAKMNACKEALKIARNARNLLGGNGISLEYPVIRHMMNLESTFTYEGTDNVHHLIIGRHITGISAFA